MDRLAELLKSLDQSEIDNAFQVLQSLRTQKDTTPTSTPSQPSEESPVTTAEEPTHGQPESQPSGAIKVEESRSPTIEGENETNTPFDKALPVTTIDNIPLAFGEFGITTLDDIETLDTTADNGEATSKDNGASEKEKTTRTSRRKEKSRPKDADKAAGMEGTESTPQSKGNGERGRAVPTPPPAPKGLASFGFVSAKPKGADTSKESNKLFSPFVPDKRIVPPSLQFWTTSGQAESSPNGDEVSAHFPFTEWIERRFSGANPGSAGGSDAAHSPSRLKSAVTEPYKGFNPEVVYAGFFAIGYDPCQARPPYFGTHNSIQDGNLNLNELWQLGRFPVGEQMPRLSVLDYEYDSGDDWDALEGEDVGASNSSDSDMDNESVASSDLDFVVSDGDGSDSECDLQRKLMEARQQRLRRLRGKEKLVSSFSGPFVGIPPSEHPLKNFDDLQRLCDLSDKALSDILAQELQAADNGAGAGNTGSVVGHDGLMEAALKNRREMTEEELTGMHEMISRNSKMSTKMIVDAFRGQQMCIGVARAEIERTVKRFYEKKHGSLFRRAEPWSASDERLFVRSARRGSAEKKKKRDREETEQVDDATSAAPTPVKNPPATEPQPKEPSQPPLPPTTGGADAMNDGGNLPLVSIKVERSPSSERPMGVGVKAEEESAALSVAPVTGQAPPVQAGTEGASW